jgi:hypothetical protein
MGRKLVVEELEQRIAPSVLVPGVVPRQPDTTPPTVTGLTPVPGSTVSVSPAVIVAQFSEALDSATVGSSSFLLVADGPDALFGTPDDIPVNASSINYSAATFTAYFNLSGALSQDVYQVTLTDSITDLAGNPLDGEYNIATFPPSGDTVAGGDFVVTFTVDPPPKVTAASPAPGALITPPTSIVLTLSEAVDGTTVDATTFLLVGDGVDNTFGTGDDVSITPASVVYNPLAKTATFNITGVLPGDTYRVTLTDSVLDLTGNALDGEFTGVFPSGNTVPGGNFQYTFDVDPAPTVTNMIPAPGSSVTAQPGTIQVTFSETINSATLNASSFLLIGDGANNVYEWGGGDDVVISPVSINYDSPTNTGTFRIPGLLPDDTYYVTLTDSVTDLVGNPLDGEYLGSLPSGDGAAGGDFVGLRLAG